MPPGPAHHTSFYLFYWTRSDAGGVPDGDITIVIALGSHRNSTEEERKHLLGPAYGRVRCIDHDKNDCKYVGTSKLRP